MANHKSAEKRNRQNKKRKKRNVANRSLAKTAAQNALEVIWKDAKGATEQLQKAISLIAKVAHRGSIPKKRASRKISRLYKARNRALSGTASK